jgi:hypothetical protein
MITARIHDDAYNAQGTFDATPWFERATSKEITELADCDWGGDYPADAIAYALEETSEVVRSVFLFTHGSRVASEPNGFEVYVDREEALSWLRLHRPWTWAAVTLDDEEIA